MRKLILLSLAATLALSVCAAGPQVKKPSALPRGNTIVGHPVAPEFSLTDLNGHKIDLAAYRGNVVLLDFWATWCAPCRSEVPGFVDLQNKYRDRGFRIIGISLDDDARPVGALYERFKMNYPVALGDARLAERYGGILGLPVSFLIGCDGRIYGRHAGETNPSLIEREIRPLLDGQKCAKRRLQESAEASSNHVHSKPGGLRVCRLHARNLRTFGQRRMPDMRSVVVIINEAPYGNERAYNGLRYAHALLAAAVQVKVYLLADAVTCAKKGQVLPKGYYNVENIISGITRRGATVHV